MRRVWVGIATAVALLSLSACGSSGKSGSADSGSTTTAPAKNRPHVTIDAFDYGFRLPASMPAGWVDVTLHNVGKTGHQIAFAKLGSTTLVAFKQAASATDVKALKDVQFVGGPNNVDPGTSVTATIHLEPGKYAVACFIPADSDGKPHAAHGMVGQVTVVQSPDSVEDAPTVEGGSISLSEFTFVPDAFTGRGMVEFKNIGTQLHEAIIVKEAPGKTVDQVKAFFLTPPGSPPPAGPPPFTPAGGIVGLGSGQTMYQRMALTPGKYVFVCFFPDPTKGNIPHALEGMFKEITVS